MTEAGRTQRAGDGVTDEQMLQQVAEQTPNDLKYADVFEREADGTLTDTEAAKASADELADGPAEEQPEG